MKTRALFSRRAPSGAATQAAPSQSWNRDEAAGYADALYDHAWWLTRRVADAEELVQETYARALAGATTFTGGNLKAWLFTILRHVHINLHRRRRPQAALGELDVIDGADERELFRDDLELDRMKGLIAEDIEAALGALSDDARSIILLDVEGFTETEVSEMLGCPVGTVKSRLARARVLLRERLKDYARS